MLWTVHLELCIHSDSILINLFDNPVSNVSASYHVDRLIAMQSVKKFRTFMGPQKFISVFSRAHHSPLPHFCCVMGRTRPPYSCREAESVLKY